MTDASIIPEFVDLPFPNGFAVEDGVVYIDSRNEVVQFSKKPSPTVSPSRNALEDTVSRTDIRADCDTGKKQESTATIQRRIIFETDQQKFLNPPEKLSVGALDSGSPFSIAEDQTPVEEISSEGKELDISHCHTFIKEKPHISAYVEVTEEPGNIIYNEVTEEPDNMIYNKEKYHNIMPLACQERKALIEDDIRDELGDGAGHNFIEDQDRPTSVEQLASTLDTRNLNIDQVNCNSKLNLVRSRLMESMMSLTVDDCTQSENSALLRSTEYDSNQGVVHEKADDRSTHEGFIPRVRNAAKETCIDKRIMEIRKNNEKIIRRFEEVEKDRTNSGTCGKSCLVIEESIPNAFSQNSIVAGLDGARKDSSGCNDISNFGLDARIRGRARVRSTEWENSNQLDWRKHANGRRGLLDKDEMRRVTREEQRVRNILICEAELQEMYRNENARMETTRSDKSEEQMWEVRTQGWQARRRKQDSFSFVNEQRNSRVSMSGKEDESYDEWKSERNKIEEERLKRSKRVGLTWKREWDREKVWNETMEEWMTPSI